MVLEEKKDLHKNIKTHFSLSFKIYTYYQWQIQIYFTIETCNKTPLQFISRIILHKIPANLDGNLALLEPFNVANSKLSLTPVGQLQEDWGRCAQILPPPPPPPPHLLWSCHYNSLAADSNRELTCRLFNTTLFSPK